MSKALAACRALCKAYQDGEDNGGSMDWEEVDQVHELALEAIKEADTQKAMLEQLKLCEAKILQLYQLIVPTGRQETAERFAAFDHVVRSTRALIAKATKDADA